MNTRETVFIEGNVLANRLIGEKRQSYYIHRVMFGNGKYAIVRAQSGTCFPPGESLQRRDCEWFFENKKIRLLPFQYINESESMRRLTEY
jgi:hypothetical protein